MPHLTPRASVAALGDRAGPLVAGHIDAAFRQILRGPAVTAERRFVRLLTLTPHPFGNFAAVSARVDRAGTEAAVEALLSCGMPSAAVFGGAVSSDVDAFLRSAGYAAAPMPGMAVDIDKLAAAELPAGYRLARLGPSELDAWAEAFAVGYELPRPVADAFATGLAPNAAADDAPLQTFAILKGDAVVATSVAFLHDGVAGIYSVATVPSERGRGLGAHVTAQPLRLAHRLGYRVGVLQSSAAGHSVYRRLGFVDVADVPLYVRMPA